MMKVRFEAKKFNVSHIMDHKYCEMKLVTFFLSMVSIDSGYLVYKSSQKLSQSTPDLNHHYLLQSIHPFMYPPQKKNKYRFDRNPHRVIVSS